MGTESTARTAQPRTELLDQVLTAHGGLDRWRAVETISATITARGALFELKGYPDGLAGRAEAVANAPAPRLTCSPFGAAARGVFEPDRVAVTTAEASEDVLENPRATFPNLPADAGWDLPHLLYFVGYALWNYLCTPFMFTRPGFELEEIEPWLEGEETWRRLRGRFPPELPSHNPDQVFYFDADGLLRRLDYAPEVVNPPSPIPAAHYCYDHKTFSGLVVPTRRRVFGRTEDGKPVPEPTFVELEVAEVTVS
jgi:hypothetical protein